MQTLQTARQVIIALGNGDQAEGFRTAARLIGRSYKAAHNWASRDRFPPETFLTFADALRARGKTASPHLWRMDKSTDCGNMQDTAA